MTLNVRAFHEFCTGLILGKALNEFPEMRTWNLSTVLRLYYGPKGIATGASQIMTHCKRRELFNKVNTRELREQIDNFAITLAHSGLITGIENKESKAKERVADTWNIFLGKLGDDRGEQHAFLHIFISSSFSSFLHLLY